MDAVEFYNTVLPARGLRCLAIPRGTGFAHVFGDSDTWLDEAARHVDTQRELNTYFAPASFKSRASRKGDNVEAVRSFWVDLDVGPKKPYASARDAAAAILGFALKLGLPRPILVASGRGVHAYWPMAEDMDPATWKATASLLKAALTAEEIGQDPSRTADVVSVLRPPGTHHRKADPRLVRVIVDGSPSTLEAFQTALLPYSHLITASAEDDVLPEGGPAAQGLAPNSDLTAGVEYRQASADRIADRCGVMALVRDTQGRVDQPTWYGALGVLGACEDGEALAHEWSKGDPRYSPEETKRKFDQWRKTTGRPALCSYFNDHQPTICAACPHAGKVKTPFTLGLGDGETVTVETVVRTPTGFSTLKTTVEAPDGFKYMPVKGRMAMFHGVPDDTGGWVDEVFCETRVIPITRLWIEGVAYIECEMDVQGEKRTFLLEGGVVGKGKDSLAGELARNEIVCKPGKGQVMDSYLKAWMAKLKEEAAQIIAHRHFGWEDRSFVLGDLVYHPGGDTTRAILVGMAKSKAPALVPQGSLQEWVRIVDRVYNAPGQEAFQFLVASSFAAPLLSMMQQVSGVTVFAHSEGSGVGKTTAQRVGLSAWGNWDELMLADKKATPNALWGLMGAYHSLPVAFDELTNMPNDVASDLVFSVSSGRSKQRMRADGELRENNANWSTIMMASGNNLLSEKLSLHRGNAEAEISRLFEFTLTASPHISPNEANSLFSLLLLNYGHAGQAYARYLVDNYDVVAAMLTRTQERLNVELGITQVERYWSALLAATLVAVALCRNLGLLQFDLRSLKTWMVARLQENRIQKAEAANDPLELFGSMMADLWEGVLVTNGEGDMRKGTVATVAQKPRGVLIGRAVIPLSKAEVPVLILNALAVKDWANKKGVSAKEMFGAAVAAGWADAEMIRYSLGRGTLEYAQTSSYLRCWKLYPRRIAEGSVDQHVAQKLGIIDGGRSDANAGVQ